MLSLFATPKRPPSFRPITLGYPKICGLLGVKHTPSTFVTKQDSFEITGICSVCLSGSVAGFLAVEDAIISTCSSTVCFHPSSWPGTRAFSYMKEYKCRIVYSFTKNHFLYTNLKPYYLTSISLPAGTQRSRL
jgi:hypothetical protein